jgi:molybdopterin-guanine dinucleotide biosynthesis protein A
LEVAGVPLVRRLCLLLETQLGKAPWLLGDGPFDAAAPHRGPLPDRAGTVGPLAGLLSLFTAEPQSDFLVLAVDLPCMDEAALNWMLHQPRHSVAALWPRQPNMNHGEPLAGIYNSGAHAYLEEAWRQGKVSPCQAIPAEQRREPLIPEPLRGAFANANRPEEWAAAQRLRQGGALTEKEQELLFPRKVCGLHGSNESQGGVRP